MKAWRALVNMAAWGGGAVLLISLAALGAEKGGL